MAAASNDLPDDIDTLKAALLAANDRAEQVTAELAVAKAKASDDQALIAHQQLQIAKLTRELYGQHSERSVRLLDQMELTFEELESSATEDELAAERAAAQTTNVVAFIRKRPARQPFPEHLPRERVVEPGPATCQCCGSARLRKLGEDVTETLEVIPRQWKVIQHVREKFTCRDCEKISQAPAPFHVIARGWAGPSLLAMILFEKYGQHQPLNRQAERYAREGVPLSLSTLADQVGACCTVLAPLIERIEAHVFAAEQAVAKTTNVVSFTRKRPARQPFPDHLPRERVVEPGPTTCLCCGSPRLRKLGEDVTETLEVIPRRWKVIQHVREKFTCRDCERISQAPAPFHVIPRGWAGPSLLAMILFEKYGQHQPLNRQAERYAREGVPLSLSTLADQVGACVAVLAPLLRRVEGHVFAAERLHGDDTTVPVLATGKTDTGRCWVYVCVDRRARSAGGDVLLFA